MSGVTPDVRPRRTRVYLPATLDTLASAFVSGGFPAGYAAHAVSPALREWYVGGDTEELEYAALTEAAHAALRLLAGELSAHERYEHRRVVVAADVDEDVVKPGQDGRYRSAVQLAARVPLTAVVSVHVDDDQARPAVAAAVAALPAADAGDDDALFAVDEAAAHELLWFDATELPDLI